MIHTLAIENYRSLLRLVVPVGRLTVVTGANGTGKSSLYRALRLLADTARGRIVPSIAAEGGLQSLLWAGPETISRRMRRGEVPVQGGPAKRRTRLRLGFAGDDFGYAIDLGLPAPPSRSPSAFALDPEIKREVIWAGAAYRPASALVDRRGPLVKVRDGRRWRVVAKELSPFDSLFTEVADPTHAPEVLRLREVVRGWRFYDHFRTDPGGPARTPQISTRTPVLAADGADVAAAMQTIREIGDERALDEAIDDAFPGATLAIEIGDDGRFRLELAQPGLLRPLAAPELSDGTLRYLLWVAALLTPRPPSLMVLNEPETSLHADLLPPLARLVARAAERSQVWIVSHAAALIEALEEASECDSIVLDKELGQTIVRGLRPLDEPSWHWPEKG